MEPNQLRPEQASARVNMVQSILRKGAQTPIVKGEEDMEIQFNCSPPENPKVSTYTVSQQTMSKSETKSKLSRNPGARKSIYSFYFSLGTCMIS